jgi:hypothetical protein
MLRCFSLLFSTSENQTVITAGQAFTFIYPDYSIGIHNFRVVYSRTAVVHPDLPKYSNLNMPNSRHRAAGAKGTLCPSVQPKVEAKGLQTMGWIQSVEAVSYAKGLLNG